MENQEKNKETQVRKIKVFLTNILITTLLTLLISSYRQQAIQHQAYEQANQELWNIIELQNEILLDLFDLPGYQNYSHENQSLPEEQQDTLYQEYLSCIRR